MLSLKLSRRKRAAKSWRSVMVAVDGFVGDGGGAIDREGGGVAAAKRIKQAPAQWETTYRQ